MSDTPENALPASSQTSPLPAAPSEEDALVGMQLGDYLVEQAIGWGGMGIVYRAVHPLIGRKVAVKVLRPGFASDPEQVGRFLQEAQAISAIKHRGIIDIINFGKLPDGRQYMVMEYLEGETLEEVMKREGAMDPARALVIVDELLEALSAAHQAGVVHRDLKPSNVYITRQTNGSRYVKLVDFGLARRASVDELNRNSGKASLMAGTPQYLSPEQVKGLAATPRTDLYSLGVILFEMVTGQLPFRSESVLELLNAHRITTAPRAGTLVTGLSPALDDLIAALLEKQPEARPQNAEAARRTVLKIARELKEGATRITGFPFPVGQRVQSGRTAAVASPPPPEASTAPVVQPRVPRWVWALVVAAVVAGALLIGSRPQMESPVLVPPPPVAPAAATEPAPAATTQSAPVTEASPEPEPVALTPRPAEPPKKEPPRRDPPKKEPARRVGPAPKPALIPEACEGTPPTWKKQLTIAFDGAEQSYTRKMSGNTDPTADRELSSFRKKIARVGEVGDCVQLMKSLEGWARKYSH